METITAESILELVATGKSVRAACVELGLDREAFKKWIKKSEENKTRYARARKDCIDAMAEDIIRIADEDTNDILYNDKGGSVGNSTAVARSRLRVEARMWLLSKVAHTKYGNKLDVTSGDKPLEKTVIERQIIG